MFRISIREILATAAIACGLVGYAACGLIDPGPDTGPPAGCNAPPDFFVSDMWPKYFDAYTCGKSDCHDASTGHGFFRLQPVSGVATPAPTDPVSTWPMPWQQNLQAVQHNLSCSNPLASAVLAIPEGRSMPHPPGDVVTDHPSADALFLTWLK
jgi:hypothetical protein